MNRYKNIYLFLKIYLYIYFYQITFLTKIKAFHIYFSPSKFVSNNTFTYHGNRKSVICLENYFYVPELYINEEGKKVPQIFITI